MPEGTASRIPTSPEPSSQALSGAPAGRAPKAPHRAAPAVALARRLPFTAASVLVLLGVGVATGALWTPAAQRSWFADIGYGLPAFSAGRWWTPLTGAFLGPTPALTVLGLVGCAALVGTAEWYLGTRRTVLVTVVGHLVTVGLAALVLLALRPTGWDWAVRLAGELGAGPIGGVLAVFTVATAVFPAPWRLRARLAVSVLVVVTFALVGSLTDLQGLLAVAIAWPLGRRLTSGPARARSGRPTRREWRLLAVAGVGVLAVADVLLWLAPRDDGPLGPVGDDTLSSVDVAMTLVVCALLANGLRKGSRVAWWWAVAVAGLNVALGVLVAVLVVVAVVGQLPYQLAGVPFFVVGRLAWAALLVVLLVARDAFAVPSRRRLRRGADSAPDRAQVVEVLHRYGGGTLSWMATWPGNTYFREPSARGVLAYQSHAGVAIGLGDPIGPADSAPDVVAEFAAMCERSRLVPCLFSVTDPTVAAAAELGWRHVQIAEDTLVDLPGLEFTGKPWQAVRSALNRAKRDGISFELGSLAEQKWSTVAQVRGISEQWVGDKGLPEMGFTLGGVDEALDPEVRVGLASDAEGRLHGVTSWLPVYGESHDGTPAVRGWTLDLMRRRHDGFRGVIEFLIASACVAFREEGAAFASLSGAPLARAGSGADGAGEMAGLERVLDGLGTVMEPLYGFRSLHTFKAKFRPRYQPMYLLYRDAADLPRIGMGLTRAYLPGVPVRELVALGVRS